MSNQVIPWTEMFRYAVQVCKIAPKDFWGMTMKEFMYLADHGKGVPSINKAELEYMINKFK